jgi:Amt family ammonium transporter
MLASFAATYLIGTLLQKTVGFRIDDEDEIAGIDLSTHAESAYDLHTGTGGPTTGVAGSVLASTLRDTSDTTRVDTGADATNQRRVTA